MSLLLIISLVLVAGAMAESQNKSGVEPQVLKLPDGPGSISGLGESFEPNLNSGTATYQVKIEVCPGVNKFQPELILTYDNGYGNGPLGLGWHLNVPYLQRRTDKGLPRYLDSDTFIYASQGELVPVGGEVYRLKIEGLFTKFLKNAESWEAWNKSGVHHIFGETAESRLFTAAEGDYKLAGVFRWMLERSVDPNGNEIRYRYFQHGGNVYLQEIRYGFTSTGTYRSVVLEYEDRADVIDEHLSRSRITTAKRLKRVKVLSEGSLVRSYELQYGEAPGTRVSLLLGVVQFGRDNQTALPPLNFRYNYWDGNQTAVVRMENSPDVSLAGAEADLVDIDGDGLPDLLYTPTTGHEFILNQGNGKWAETPLKPAVSPGFQLSTNGVLMADLTGAGRSDLVVQTATEFGFFKNTGKPWEKEADWVAYNQPPFSLENPNTRLVDLDNDGLIDVLHSDSTRFYGFLNSPNNPWLETFEAANPGLLPSDPHVRFADMNGDHLDDLVYLDPSGDIYFLPNQGFGSFGQEVFMTNSPHLPDAKIRDQTILLMDVNGDGLSDLVQVDSGQATIWLNRGDRSFSAPIEIMGAADFHGQQPVLRQADMNGDGCRDLLISLANAPTEERYQYLDFCKTSRANTLSRIDNGLGMQVDIYYQSSTHDYLQARDRGNPWTTKLPFPVQVVSRRVVRDQNSGQEYVTDYRYRDGYYDAGEREFRGFAEVEVLAYGDATVPTLRTHHVFDVGEAEESRKGMVLETATLDQNGTIEPPSGLYRKTDHELFTRTLALGTNGKAITFSFTAQTDAFIFEKTQTAKQLRTVFDYDDFGNEIKKAEYGLIEASNLGVGNDELITTSEFFIWTENGCWMVDRPKRISQTDLHGNFVSGAQSYYDAPCKGNLVRQEKSPDGASCFPVVRNDYDSYGNIIKMTDASDHFRIIEYDPTFHTFPVAETIGGLGLTMSAGYDRDLGKITSFTDFNSQVTQFGYDVFGRLIRIVKPGDTETLPTQQFTYQLRNPVSFIKKESREVSGETGTYDAYTYFDGLGRKLQVRSEAENSQWVVSEAVAFNQHRQPAWKWLPYFAAAPDYEPADWSKPYAMDHYDPTDRVVKETNPDGSFKTTLYLPLAKQAWDEEDNALDGTHTGTPHTFFYDGIERLVQVEERNAGATYITRYGYDGLNNLVRILDNQNNLNAMTFDGLGRKTYMNDPDKGEMRYWYDAVGNLEQTLDNKGQQVNYTYDAANRIVTESSGGVRVRYHYDSDLPPERSDLQYTLGRLAYVEDEAGRGYFSYDHRGKPVLKGRSVGGNTFLQGMSYDAMDRLTTLIYPDGFRVDYQYNAMNQLKAIPGYVDHIDYNASGQKTRFVYANGVQSTYQYDLRYRLKTLNTTGREKTLQDLTYEYDLTSNITAITDLRSEPTPESRTRSFTYDDLYRLTNATALTWQIAYSYDSIGNLVNQTSNIVDYKVNLGVLSYGQGGAGPHAVTQAGSFAYAYDGNGNIKTKADYAFSFDYKDRMISAERDATGMHAQYQYGYDGNRVAKTVTTGATTETTLYPDKFAEVRNGQIIDHIFAGDRRVASISKPFDAGALAGKPRTLTFEDFDQNRDGVIGLEEIRSQGDDPQKVELGEARDAIKIFRQVLDPNPGTLPFGIMAAAIQEVSVKPVQGMVQTVYYIPDHLGSPALMADEYGNVIEESVYYPYGMNKTRTGGFHAQYRFTGKELDDESNLHYFGARYFDPMVGRFTSVDPLLSNVFGIVTPPTPKHQPAYTYVSNNPLKFVDPIGLSKKDNINKEKMITTSLRAPSLKVVPVVTKGKKGGSYIQRSIQAQMGKGYRRYAPGAAKWAPKVKGASHSLEIVGDLADGDVVSAVSDTFSLAGDVSEGLGKADLGEKLGQFGTLISVVKGGYDELTDRGYTLSNLGNAIWDIRDNISFAMENPDALSDALVEGLTSMSAVCIQTVTAGIVDVSGKDIQSGIENGVNKALDWFGL